MHSNPASTVPRWLHGHSQSTTLRLAAVVTFAAVVALSAWRVTTTLHRPGDVPEFQQGLTDFHHIFVFPAMAARQGINPYGTDYMEQFRVNRPYPLLSPATFWLAYPLAFVPLTVADTFYFSASVALTIGLAASALRIGRVPCTLVNVFGLASLILLSRPGHVNLLLGQATLPLVLGAVWALEFAQRRPRIAGVALAVTTLKPTFGVPLIWLMLCRRDYRAVILGTVLGGSAVIAGFAPFAVRDGWRPLLASLVESQAYHEADKTVAAETSWTRLDAPSLFGKLFSIPSSGELVLTAVILLTAGWLLWRTPRGSLTEGADNLSSLLICTATLACIYHGTYDALLLVVPWIGAMLGNLRNQLPVTWRVVVPVLLTIPAVNYLSARAVLGRLPIEAELWTAITAINSLALLLAFLLACFFLLRSQVLRTHTATAGRRAVSASAMNA